MEDQQSDRSGEVIDQEMRKDFKGKKGNIAIVTFSTKDSAEKP